ncbi:MAG: DUF6544 family protein [Myxococcota bacterium]
MLERLWDTTPRSDRTFDHSALDGLPEPARRYLAHAVAPGTPLASAVRLRMHGTIRLKGWCSFRAEQVIRPERGMVWRAAVKMGGLPVKGFDRVVDGEGAMRWRLLGLIPVVNASGPDVARSAAGRIAGELVWLPSALCGDDVIWTASDDRHATAAFTVQGYPQEVTLAVADDGRPESVRYRRWGDPEGGDFHEADFGGVVEEEATFGGYTIPTRLRIGWHFDGEGFAADGEFFRGEVDEATFR